MFKQVFSAAALATSKQNAASAAALDTCLNPVVPAWL